MHRLAFLLLVVASLVAATGARAAVTVKVGTLVPQDSPWGKELKRLARQLSADTGGEVQLDVQWNGQAGDEGLMVQKMRAGQLDAAMVTARGLAQTGVTDALVFELPGLFETWAQLDAARAAVQGDLDRQFEARGFTCMGWGDVGATKMMTSGFEVHRPTDLRGKGVFVLPGDPVGPALFAEVGGLSPRPTTVPEILPGLATGALTVLPVPALVAEQLQWASRVTHVASPTTGFNVGAFIVSSARLKTLSPQTLEIVNRRGAETSARLTHSIRELDAQSFARLRNTKIVYDLTPAEKAEWWELFARVRKGLRGAVFSPALYDRVAAFGAR
jgi:TRAP-type C4-dicarboxylate transport system substrate-binding protein